jgi:hypothetical protein
VWSEITYDDALCVREEILCEHADVEFVSSRMNKDLGTRDLR